MLALAAHARDVTSELFAGLQSLDNVDNLRAKIDSYVEYVSFVGTKVHHHLILSQKIS
jgi:hypothetical protein